MNGTCLFTGIVFIAVGVLFAKGLIHEHLAMWKQMSAEQRARYDMTKLCRNVGMIVGSCGAIFLAAGLSSAFKENLFIWAMIIWFITTGVDAYKLQFGSRRTRRSNY